VKYGYAYIPLFIIMLFTEAAGALQFQDVPREHWAYETIDMLSDRGIIRV